MIFFFAVMHFLLPTIFILFCKDFDVIAFTCVSLIVNFAEKRRETLILLLNHFLLLLYLILDFYPLSGKPSVEILGRLYYSA